MIRSPSARLTPASPLPHPCWRHCSTGIQRPYPAVCVRRLHVRGGRALIRFIGFIAAGTAACMCMRSRCFLRLARGNSCRSARDDAASEPRTRLKPASARETKTHNEIARKQSLCNDCPRRQQRASSACELNAAERCTGHMDAALPAMNANETITSRLLLEGGAARAIT